MKTAVEEHRVQYIDGLRGVAVLAVVLFHAYSSHESITPFSQPDLLGNSLDYGWLGVQLFFAISGYCIYGSLLRTNGFWSFATARYFRLAPAMLLGSLLIFFSSLLTPIRPAGDAYLIDFIPSITFIDPVILRTLGFNVSSLDGAFWSLFIEIRFYVLASLVFFLNDKKLNSLAYLWVAYLMLIGFSYGTNLDALHLVVSLLNFYGIQYYGWFMLGVFSHRWKSTKSGLDLILLLLIGCSAAFTTRLESIGITLAAIIVVAIFFLPLVSESIRTLLTSRFLMFFGFVSYPLYLIHQNIVTGWSINFYHLVPSLPSYVYPIPFMLICCGIAYVIALLERPIRNRMKGVLRAPSL